MTGTPEARRREITFPLPPADNPLWDLLLDGMNAKPRFDIAIEPSAAERKPCPVCGAPGEKVTYHGMIAVSDADAEGKPGVVRMSINGQQVEEGSPRMHMAFADCQRVTFEPCGHRFDGRTGEPIESE